MRFIIGRTDRKTKAIRALGAALHHLRRIWSTHKLFAIMDGRTSKWFEMHRTVVMPAHCDQYGHMNVRHYAAFFDDAGWHMFAHAGVSLSDLNSRGLGSVVATLTIEFHHEITAGQLAMIRGAFTRVGTKSFDYALELYEADSMTHCATQKVVEVCFDTAKRTSVALPGDVRVKLLAMLDDANVGDATSN